MISLSPAHIIFAGWDGGSKTMLKLMAVALALIAGPAWAAIVVDPSGEYIEMPDAALTPYRTFREAMIAAGWTPVDKVQTDTPELMCGWGVCAATFRLPHSDLERNFRVVRGDKEFLISPEISMPIELPPLSN